MSHNKAEFNTNSSYLLSDYGLQLACEKLNISPDEVKEIVGVYTKGPLKGKLRGIIKWTKVIKGGWFRTYNREGIVMKPGKCFGYAIVENLTDKILKVDKEQSFHSNSKVVKYSGIFCHKGWLVESYIDRPTSKLTYYIRYDMLMGNKWISETMQYEEILLLWNELMKVHGISPRISIEECRDGEHYDTIQAFYG